MEICCMQTFYLVVYPRLLLCHEETRLFLEPQLKSTLPSAKTLCLVSAG